MSAQPSMSVPATGFAGIPERRFPLNLGEELPRVERIWTVAKGATWDPVTDIPWNQLDLAKYTEEERYAARVFWSRRAWSEYTGLAESPTVLLRFAFEGDRPGMIKLALATKFMDEAKHVEASYLMAEKLGGYLPEPPEGAPRKRLVAGLRERGLNPDYTPEAVLGCWHCVSEYFAVEIFRVRYHHTTDPVARAVLGRILADEVRHIGMGWEYLAYRLPQVSEEVRQNVKAAMMDVIENVELGGFHSSSNVNEEQDLFARLDLTVAKAGLGAAPPEVEHEAFVSTLAEIRKKAGELGIDLPEYKL
ncbi:MAG: ferritin-like domain-containing protein [Pigmentiphaga sp.]|uniref:ferritin-like domain-containing protein n=1 Tax=Pigmentiphaga sp. TaxID=1977564 RepID=UPI0029B9E03B|nr:ferritin-like domain-containing protein [Pigmentiphaga sp.]MDX3907308.1 ferritin-like domain-containing protein [Pigmentiphaga sp.]